MSTVFERVRELLDEAQEIENHPDFISAKNVKLLAKYLLIKSKLDAFSSTNEINANSKNSTSEYGGS
jgi:hypothetical protein